MDLSGAHIWTSVAILAICFRMMNTASGGELDEYRLVQSLLTNYSSNVRPVADPAQVLDVHIHLALNQIIDLDERNQILSTKVWMNWVWSDVSLTWDPADFANITSVRILGDHLWRPDITLYNDVRDDLLSYEKHYSAVVKNTGDVSFMFPTIIRSTCKLNVDYFPWDQQSCELKFGSWTYDGFKIDIFNGTPTGNLGYFAANGEWEMIGIPLRRHELYYACCPEPFPDVTYWVVIRRKPLYYLFNLILPCIFITATTILVFYLPSESGEKVSLGVTVLLALTVFLLLVAETMPPQSDSVPLIAQYFGATIVLLATSTALTVVVLNVYYRGAFGNEVPAFIELVVLNWLARSMCLRKRVEENFTPPKKKKVRSNHVDVVENGCVVVNSGLVVTDLEDTNHLEMKKPNPSHQTPVTVTEPLTESGHVLNQICVILKEFQKRQDEQAGDDGCRTNWMLVAMVIDRFLLVVFILLTVIVSCVILMNRPRYDYDTVTAPLEDAQ